jgi:hypothetical protein
MTRYDPVSGLREAVLILHDVPGTQPAHAPLSQLNVNPLGLIQQLEHRVNSLAELRQTTATRQQAAQQEASRAREALGRSFKYADQLATATRRLAEINQQMTNRQDTKAREQHAQALKGDPAPSNDLARSPATPAPVPPDARICRDAETSSPGRHRDAGR